MEIVRASRSLEDSLERIVVPILIGRHQMKINQNIPLFLAKLRCEYFGCVLLCFR